MLLISWEFMNLSLKKTTGYDLHLIIYFQAVNGMKHLHLKVERAYQNALISLVDFLRI